MQIPIFCGDCGAKGSVGRVTASLRCKCGSANLGLDGIDNVRTAGQFTDPGGHHVQRYIDWAKSEGHDPEHTETLKKYEQQPGVGRAHTNYIADQLYIGGGDSDWRSPHNRTSARTAAPHGPGTGWGKSMPDPLNGWASEYEGPRPQVMHRDAPVNDPRTCPVCHGTGRDPVSDRGPCRECGGSGTITHPTDQPSVESADPGRNLPQGGAHWSSLGVAMGTRAAAQGPSSIAIGVGGFTTEAQARLGGRPSTDPYGSVEQHLRTTTPGYTERGPAGPAKAGPFNPNDAETFYPKATERSPNVKGWNPGSASDGPYRMDQASCPNCGTRPTELVKDKNEDAWWHCPHCGPLANIDKRPEINPYSPPEGFQPDRNMRTGGFLARNRKTGRLMQMLAVIHDTNELSEVEAVTLARDSLARYGEGR